MIEEHRGPLEYDWRTRFRLSLDVIGGRRMSWGDAIRLMRILRQDPSSHFAASLEGWSRPVTSEWALLADIFDLQHASKAKKRPDPMPRPWDKGKAKTVRRHGDAAGRTMAEIRDILNAHGHALPPV